MALRNSVLTQPPQTPQVWIALTIVIFLLFVAWATFVTPRNRKVHPEGHPEARPQEQPPQREGDAERINRMLYGR